MTPIEKRLRAAFEWPSLITRDDLEALLADQAAFRADAERFRWLCDQELPDWMDVYHQHPDRVRDNIDAAMTQEQPK